MKWISIVTRRLKEGKTYQDFRDAWYHSVGFGTEAILYSAINVVDPREVIVVAIGDIRPDRDPRDLLRIDVNERRDHPMDAVIEPEIGRRFGLMVSEDDFSPAGPLERRGATVGGRPTDFTEIDRGLAMARTLLAEAARARDRTPEGGSPR